MATHEVHDADTHSSEVDKILCLRKDMIPCKLLFFFMDASGSCFWNYLTLFLISIGLTVTQAGAILGLGGGLLLFLGPFWGILIDSIKRNHVPLFMSLSLITTAVHFWCPWFASWVTETEYIVQCQHNSTGLNGSDSNCTHLAQLANQNMLFVAFLLNAVINTVFMAGLGCYTEGIVMKRVFNGNSDETYGEQKAFGPIGYAIGSFLAGVLVDSYKPLNLSPFTATFYLFLPLNLLTIPFLYIITKQIDWGKKGSEERKNRLSIFKDVANVFKNVDNFMFIMAVFMQGMALNIFEGYLYLYMLDKMHTKKTNLALATVIATISEAIIYPMSAKLIKVAGGPVRSIIFGMVIFSLRLLFLSWCTQPWHVFINQSLRGFTLSLPWAAMVQHIWLIFPKDMTTTAVGILHSIFFIGSAVITNFVGGYVYNKYKGEILFRGMAVLCGVSALFFLFYFQVILRNRTKELEQPYELGNCNNASIENDEEAKVDEDGKKSEGTEVKIV